jgi:ABC-type multidrug transport system permease subunit
VINFRAHYAYIRATLRLTARDRTVLFFSYLFPVIFFFAFGEGFDAAKSSGNAAQVISMVLVLGVLGNGFFGGGIRAVMEREAGILRRFKVAPISPAPILVSSIVTGWVIYMPAVVVFFVLANVRYHMPLPTNPISLFILLSLGIVAFRAMGLIIASVVNTMSESQILVQLLYFPMLLLSGATIPLSTMPDWLQVVAQFLPATHLYLGLQGILMHGESAWRNLSGMAALAATAAVCLFISVKLFRWEKEDKLKPSAKLWVAAALAPFLLLGGWQAASRTNLEKTRILVRQQNRGVTWLIRDARLFTGDGRVIERASVLIRDGVIARVYEGHGPAPESLRAEAVEAAGRTLLPGLIDSAVELPAGDAGRIQQALETHLYSGVTGVVAVGPQAMTSAATVTARIESGALLAAQVLGVAAAVPADSPYVAQEWAADLLASRTPVLLARSLTQQITRGKSIPSALANPHVVEGKPVPYSLAGWAGLPHGPSLHRQMQLMVRAGIPPAAVLAQFTSEAATRLNKPLGRIAPGLEATLLLVDGNPLEDISATERIIAVFIKGERVARAQLVVEE